MGPAQPGIVVVVARPMVVVVEASTVAASPPADVSVTVPGSVLVVTTPVVVAGARLWVENADPVSGGGRKAERGGTGQLCPVPFS